MGRIEEDELAKGMLPPIVVSAYILGTDTAEHILLKGGQHPRMRFVDDLQYSKSFSAVIAFNTTDAAFTLKKGAGRITAAVTAGGLAAQGAVERFTRTAGAAGVDEDRVTIFEIEDDVVLVGDGAGNAATWHLVQLTFDRIK